MFWQRQLYEHIGAHEATNNVEVYVNEDVATTKGAQDEEPLQQRPSHRLFRL